MNDILHTYIYIFTGWFSTPCQSVYHVLLGPLRANVWTLFWWELWHQLRMIFIYREPSNSPVPHPIHDIWLVVVKFKIVLIFWLTHSSRSVTFHMSSGEKSVRIILLLLATDPGIRRRRIDIGCWITLYIYNNYKHKIIKTWTFFRL